MAALNGHLGEFNSVSATYSLKKYSRNGVRSNFSTDIVKLLVSNGADAGTKTTDSKETPLHLSSANGHLGVVRDGRHFDSGAVIQNHLVRERIISCGELARFAHKTSEYAFFAGRSDF